MDKAEFMEGIHVLQDNYNKKLSTSQLKLFYENLKDMDKDRYILNIKEIIKASAFMPTIAQIRNEQRQAFADYEQRKYTEIDFEELYANKQYVKEKR